MKMILSVKYTEEEIMFIIIITYLIIVSFLFFLFLL